MMKLWNLLTAGERRSLVALYFILLGVAVVELIGIAAIAAFVTLVTDPDGKGAENPLFVWIKSVGEFENQANFIAFAGLCLLGVIVIRNLYVMASTWIKYSVLYGLRRNLSARLIMSYLSEPYLFFTRSNSATLTKNITSEVHQLIMSNLYSWLMILSDSVLALSILGLLIWSSPLTAILAVGALGAVSIIILLLMRRYVEKLGAFHRYWNGLVYKAANEAFGAAKEIKILGREKRFADRLRDAAHGFSRTSTRRAFTNELPRSILEIIVVASILAIAVIGASDAGGFAQVAGTLALFVAAFYRLMPIATRMTNSINGLNFNRALLDDLAATLNRGLGSAEISSQPAPALPFAKSIEFKDVSFSYAADDDHAISHFDMVIDHKSSVAIVGPSGAGKSTLIDLLLGLLQPTEGEILVDGTKLDEHNIRSWQRNIGYVPQEIFLVDSSVMENIAIGIPPNEIDQERLKKAASAAHIDEFVADLPNGFETIIGERGLRLSGGQRQRIGLARALYRKAEFLVLDEATSALDGITEAFVQNALKELAGQVTIITIAHRLQTVRDCDAIHLMENGKITSTGTYDQLMETNKTFRAMAREA